MISQQQKNVKLNNNNASKACGVSGAEGKSILKDRVHNSSAEIPSSSVIEVTHSGSRTVVNNMLSPCRRPEGHENSSSISSLTIVTPTSPRGQQLEPLESAVWMREGPSQHLLLHSQHQSGPHESGRHRGLLPGPQTDLT